VKAIYLFAVKVALLCLSVLAVGLTSCTTIQNRRDLYCGYGHVCGPYSCGKYKVKTQTVIVTSDSKAIVNSK
jgi:hypothetical protein